MDLICLEGIQGAGKSTQIALLRKCINGIQVIPEFTQDNRFQKAFQEQTESSEAAILPFLKIYKRIQGEIYAKTNNPGLSITDRGFYSLMVFGSEFWSIDKIEEMGLSLGIEHPTKYIILDCSPEVAFQRIIQDKKRSSSQKSVIQKRYENLSFMRLVRKKYLELSSRPNTFLINAERAPEEVLDDIKRIIETN